MGVWVVSWFRTSRYDSPRINQGPSRRTPTVWCSTNWKCASRGKTTVRKRPYRASKVTVVPQLERLWSPFFYLDTATLDGRGRRGVMGSTGRRGYRHPILRKIERSLAWKVSDRDNRSARRRGVCPSAHRRTITGVSSVRGRISLMDFNDFI